MTPDDLYEAGFEDGKAGKAMNASWMTDPNYTMGYEDGQGSAAMDKPSSDDYRDFNDPPEGFEYAGVKRVPQPYEFYLSKGGNATFLTRPRKNNQTRHILICSECHKYDARQCYHHSVKGSK